MILVLFSIIHFNMILTTICIWALVGVRYLFLATLLLVPLGHALGSIGAVIFSYVANVTPSYTLGKALWDILLLR